MQINTSSILETKIEDKFYVLKSENDGKKQEFKKRNRYIFYSISFSL